MSALDSPDRSAADHAIVIGGSMAGLAAARALGRHCRRVTVLERDKLPVGVAQRRGVPQGKHTHALLAGGLAALEFLFPGIDAELTAAGAVRGDTSSDLHWFFEGGELRAAPSGIEGFGVSRPLLESVARERVRALPNVEIRDEAQVEGWTVESERVTGVRLPSETLAADLVVDTTGRGSRTPKRLEEIGFPGPAEERVEVGIGYATRRFRRESHHLRGKIAAVVPSTPEGKRGGVILAQEGNVWIVTLFSHFGNYAPLDLDGFIEYARGLPAPWVYEVIREAEPVGDPVATRYPASERRRYENLDRFPEGLLVLGDGICSFNPIYGQGMSSAALQAVELDGALEEGGGDLARRFFRRAAKVVDIPWGIAVGNDLRMPEVPGPRPLATRFVNWYVAKLHRAAHRDASLAHAFFRVTNLLAQPPSILAPGVAWRVVRGNLRG